MPERPRTIVTGVIGYDCHVVGHRLLCHALEEAGFKVVGLGTFCSPEGFVPAGGGGGLGRVRDPPRRGGGRRAVGDPEFVGKRGGASMVRWQRSTARLFALVAGSLATVGPWSATGFGQTDQPQRGGGLRAA